MKKNAFRSEILECDFCDFNCCKQSEWNRHLLTRKHENRTKLNAKNAENATPSYACKNCKREYKARNSLWYHEHKCVVTETNANKELLNLICEQTKTMEKITNQNAELHKQNCELVNKALELCKPVTNTIVNQTNNNNQKFNINVFLNETCKDAINFSDFIKNIDVSY
jgi:hypothetical protein